MNEIREAAVLRKKENYRFPFSAEAVKALILRVCGADYARAFTVSYLEGEGDAYSLSDAADGGLLLRATSGVAAAAALRRYLEERCASYVGLLTERLSLPAVPPPVKTPLTGESPYLYRYFFNYCTFGYTCAFWNFEDWERFLDRLLMQGYNLVLNPIGNERVWENTLLSLGYTLEEARRFLSAPVFYPWQCMMNISGYGSAAPADFYDDRVALSQKFTQRLNELGAEVVLPGYSGIVPESFSAHFKEAKLLLQGDWCDFKRPPLISYEDPLFQRVAEAYYKEQEKLFGKHSYFSVDPFHEGGNSQSVDMYAYGKTCISAMKAASSTAVWVLQGWSTNPNRRMLEALSPADSLIINLKSEVNIDGGDDFHHRPWLYGGVNNFGARRVPRANIESQYTGPRAAIQNPAYSCVGLALLPEGVELDEASFDIFADLAFQNTATDLGEWLDGYLLRRYGRLTPRLHRAWQLLVERVYIHDTSATPKESPFSTRPALSARMITPACGTDAFTYQPTVLLEIVQLLRQELPQLVSSVSFRFDLCELLRQIVALTGWGVLLDMKKAFEEKDKDAFSRAEASFMSLFGYLERVMADSPIKTLDEYLKEATRYGKTAEEKAYFADIYKTLITSWGDERAAEILHDYSAREWSGMIEGFYMPRWQEYFSYIRSHFETGEKEDALNRAFPYYEIERRFCQSTEAVPRAKAESFAYIDALLREASALLQQQSITVSFVRQSNAMELK